MDAEESESGLPERRILKGAYLMSNECYDMGNKELTLLQVQRARGTGQSWAIVVPGILPELRALDLFLGPTSGPWVEPRGNEEE